MTCNICDNDYGMSFCKNDCSYITCQNCAHKAKTCPQCKIPLKINMFFAGKICADLTEEDLEKSSVCYYDLHRPCEKTRRFVTHSDYCKDQITCSKHGRLELHKKDIIDYSDYIDTKKELSNQEIGPTTNLTGPFIVIHKDCVTNHGCWQQSFYDDVTDIPNIVNERNNEAIKKSDVFSLKINSKRDCFRSMAEWGIASLLGKTLILEPIDPDRDPDPRGMGMRDKHTRDEYIEKINSDFYMFAAESIQSLERLSFQRREAIFTSHPRLDINYKKYKQMMEKLISRKKLPSKDI